MLLLFAVKNKQTSSRSGKLIIFIQEVIVIEQNGILKRR